MEETKDAILRKNHRIVDFRYRRYQQQQNPPITIRTHNGSLDYPPCQVVADKSGGGLNRSSQH